MRLSCLKQHYLFISYAVCFWFVCLLPVAVAATVLASPFTSLLLPLLLPFLLLLLLAVRCLVALSLPRQKLIFINSAHTQRGTHRSRKQAYCCPYYTPLPPPHPCPLSLLSIAAACHGPTTIDRFNGYRRYRCGRCVDCVDLFALVLIWLWLKIPLSEANKCGFPLPSPLPLSLVFFCFAAIVLEDFLFMHRLNKFVSSTEQQSINLSVCFFA